MSEPIQIHPKGSASSTAGALRVVFLYAGFSGLWILLSDRVVAALFQDPAAMTLVSMIRSHVNDACDFGAVVAAE